LDTEVCVRDFVLSLAHEARRTSLVTALRQQQGALTLARLDELLCSRKYGDDLAQLTIEELLEPVPRATMIRAGESVEDAILRVFRAQPETWLTSGFFTRYLDLPRWTAQSALAELAERGLLVRQGKTSSTRYRLPPRSSPRC
jgi:Fic family protein